MDKDQQIKRQRFKVIVSEVIMTLSVVITVAILALVVSGYWLNSDFKIERQGMLQISSIPTGANVEVDGESSWFQRTNTSKILASGAHDIILSKDGYDTWSKNITISEGLLYRVAYPRLFLKNREKETLLRLTGSTAAFVSPNHEAMLVANDTTEWTLINLDRTELEPKKIDISSAFSNISIAEDAAAGLFTGEIISAVWNRDNSRILIHATSDALSEWVLLDAKNPTNSLNITKEFGTNFDHVDILDNSANNLLSISDHKLQKIDVSSKSISAVIVDQVNCYSFFKNEVIFSAKNNEDKSYIGLVKFGDNKTTVLEGLDAPARAFISRFYEDDFIIVLSENHLQVYKKDNLEEVADLELSFVPENITVGRDGSFVLLNAAEKIATLDMETLEITDWSADGDFHWLDEHMIYTTLDGELAVYDYDGLNKRYLAKNVSSHFPVALTANKWLYYFSDDELMREWLVAR